MSLMTQELLVQALPKNLRGAATQELVDKINGAAADPDIADAIKDNFISYSKVLQDGKFKTEDYLSAVTYVSYKIMGYNNQDAYARTFPDRWARHALLGTSSKDLSSYVSMYNKGKLVNLVLEQSLIPSWILNQDVYQKAINTQLELMTSANSEKVRSDAANSILTHLKPPEVKKVEIDVSLKDNSGMSDLRATMAAMAEQQLELIKAGAGTQSVARAPLLLEDQVTDVAFVEVKPQPEPIPVPLPLERSLFDAGATPAQPAASPEAETGDATPPSGRRPSLFDPLP